MEVNFRNRIDQLGKKGKRLEGQILRQAGGVVADAIADNINRSKVKGPQYKHLEDNIIVTRTKTNKFGERHVEVSAIKELQYRLKFLENGTSKMAPRAPMTIGVAESKDEVRVILTQGMKKVLKI